MVPVREGADGLQVISDLAEILLITCHPIGIGTRNKAFHGTPRDMQDAPVAGILFIFENRLISDSRIGSHHNTFVKPVYHLIISRFQNLCKGFKILLVIDDTRMSRMG